MISSNDEYPFYIKNTGAYNGIPNEDIDVLPVWNKNIKGKGIHIRFYIPGCNAKHEAFGDRYYENMSYNYETKNRNVSKAEDTDLILGTSAVSIATAGLGKGHYAGVAPESTFSVIVPNNKEANLQNYLDKLKTTISTEDIIVDHTTFCNFPWFTSHHYFYYRYVDLVDSFLRTYVSGRIYHGIVFCISTRPYREMPHLFIHYQHVLQIAACDVRGGSGSNPQHDFATVVCAPSTGIPNLDFYPNFPTAKYNNLTGENNYTQFCEASIAAGVAALIIQNNPKLSARDIQWILALSSTKNDPNHPSWFKNAAGYRYNPYYGFGRINASAAVEMSSTWSNNVLPTHRIVLSRKVNINQTIPFARTGKIELTFSFNISDPDCIVENVIFKFNVSNHDISRLRIYLESPSGTKIELMKPSKLFRTSFIKSDFYASEPLQLLARCFFGEKVGSDWKVTIVDGSFYTGNYISMAVLTIEYMAECENLPKMNDHEGHHSAFDVKSSVDTINLKINKTDLVCGIEYPFSMNDVGHKNQVYMSIVDPETNYSQKLEYRHTKSKYQFTIPCYYEGTREFYISARSFTLEQVSSVRVRVTNKNSIFGFTVPEAYENFNSNPATPTFKSVTVIDNRHKFIQTGISDYYLISLYDMDTNTLEYSSTVYSIDSPTIEFIPGIKKTVHAILTMVPSNAEDNDPCNTYIMPIVISNDTPQDLKFAVPLNDFCPIPNGVITKLPITPTPSSKDFFKTAAGISVIVVIILVPVSISLGVFIYYRSRKLPKVRSALSDQLLL